MAETQDKPRFVADDFSSINKRMKEIKLDEVPRLCSTCGNASGIFDYANRTEYTSEVCARCGMTGARKPKPTYFDSVK